MNEVSERTQESTDRSVLITGTSSGIGRATARRFLDEGWTVYATARDRDDIDDLAADGCETVALDVTDPEAPKRVVEQVVDESGGIDCLVNNAGFAQRGTIEDIPPRKFHHQFDVNLFGPHRLIRAALPHMREAGDGTIVNVSSFFGRVSAPGMGTYAGSKMALEAVSDAVRGEVRGQGVSVVLVEPGPVATNFRARTEEELADIDQSPVYEDIYRLYEDGARLSDAFAVEPAAVADTIFSATATDAPRPRYTVGTVAKLAVSFRFVPHTVRDRLYGLLRRLV